MIKIDSSRDAKLTHFGKATLADRYLLDGESSQELFQRVAGAYASDLKHGQRMYDYISKLWFMPSTPILSNAATNRGLPISCYLNRVDDSLESIAKTWNENIWIGARGGGIGTCWSDVRSVGEPVRGRGGSSGVIPFIKVMDSLVLGISQGSLRRGSAACYLSISHPEIEEFLEMRKASGDFNRKSLNLHHGVVISDAFMHAVELDKMWELSSPESGFVIKKVSARELFQSILETRLATGEPYLLFIDTVNAARPSHHKKLNLWIKQSNLCAEVTLPTGKDYMGQERTAVCCLGSVNAEFYESWKNEEIFIEDCLRFLDNVLTSFSRLAFPEEGLKRARYSVLCERSVGLGVMGLHSYFQRNNVAFGSAAAKFINKAIFKHLRVAADVANTKLARQLGSCLDAKGVKEERRFSYMLAVAPTASISIIAGGTSPCVEPWNANIFTQKTLTGSFEVKNKYLMKILDERGQNIDEVWHSIIQNDGSVQHLDFLDEREKDVFKTAFEIDQRWVIELAADRAPFIDQSQSINLFLNGDVSKLELLMLHYNAWKRGIKSLYYLRSKSLQRAGFAEGVAADNTIKRDKVITHDLNRLESEGCLVCQ